MALFSRLNDLIIFKLLVTMEYAAQNLPFALPNFRDFQAVAG